jgi:hypothetical protein
MHGIGFSAVLEELTCTIKVLHDRASPKCEEPRMRILRENDWLRFLINPEVQTLDGIEARPETSKPSDEG